MLFHRQKPGVNKDAVLYIIVITKWLTVTKYPIPQMAMGLFPLGRFFLSSIT
jgi:hypothetical protein